MVVYCGGTTKPAIWLAQGWTTNPNGFMRLHEGVEPVRDLGPNTLQLGGNMSKHARQKFFDTSNMSVKDIPACAKRWILGRTDILDWLVNSSVDQTLRTAKAATATEFKKRLFLNMRSRTPAIEVTMSQKNELGKAAGRLLLACGMVVWAIANHAEPAIQTAMDKLLDDSAHSSDLASTIWIRMLISNALCNGWVISATDWANFNWQRSVECMSMIYEVKRAVIGAQAAHHHAGPDWSLSIAWMAEEEAEVEEESDEDPLGELGEEEDYDSPPHMMEL